MSLGYAAGSGQAMCRPAAAAALQGSCAAGGSGRQLGLRACGPAGHLKPFKISLCCF